MIQQFSHFAYIHCSSRSQQQQEKVVKRMVEQEEDGSVGSPTRTTNGRCKDDPPRKSSSASSSQATLEGSDRATKLIEREASKGECSGSCSILEKPFRSG